jgi:hypothetical protein
MHGGLDALYEKVRADTRVASQGDLVIPVVIDDGFRGIQGDTRRDGLHPRNELKGYWNISSLAAAQASDGSTESVFAPYHP